MAVQLILTNGWCLARRVLMDRARDHVFADAALAGQQNRGARRRNALHGVEDFAHGRAAPDDVVELIARIQFFAHALILSAQKLNGHRFLHDGGQVIERERLLKEIGGAELHRLDCRFDRAVRRHDDDGCLNAARLQLLR